MPSYLVVSFFLVNFRIKNADNPVITTTAPTLNKVKAPVCGLGLAGAYELPGVGVGIDPGVLG